MTYHKIYIKYNNISTINLIKNLIQHSRSKYIEIRHHLIKDHVWNNNVIFEFVSIDNQIADIFIKLLSKEKFCSIGKELEIYDPSS